MKRNIFSFNGRKKTGLSQKIVKLYQISREWIKRQLIKNNEYQGEE